MLVNFVTLGERCLSVEVGKTSLNSVTHKSACPTTNENHKAGQVWSVIRQGVACIINDGGVVVRHEQRPRAIDREREEAVIRDRIVFNAADCRVLERDDGVVETCDGDGVDGVSGTGSVPGTYRTIIA